MAREHIDIDDRLPPMHGDYVAPGTAHGVEIAARQRREREFRGQVSGALAEDEELPLLRSHFSRWQILVVVEKDDDGAEIRIWTARPLDRLTPDEELRATCAAGLALEIIRAEHRGRR